MRARSGMSKDTEFPTEYLYVITGTVSGPDSEKTAMRQAPVLEDTECGEAERYSRVQDYLLR